MRHNEGAFVRETDDFQVAVKFLFEQFGDLIETKSAFDFLVRDTSALTPQTLPPGDASSIVANDKIDTVHSGDEIDGDFSSGTVVDVGFSSVVEQMDDDLFKHIWRAKKCQFVSSSM